MKTRLSLVCFLLSFIGLSGCLPSGPSIPKIERLAAGVNHACSLDNRISGLQCWGDNSHGQIAVPYLGDPRRVAAGRHFTCAVNTSQVVCWGDNSLGQTSVPAGLSGVGDIAAGFDHACALHGGSVTCWGDDSFGQVSAAPVLQNVTAISAGAHHSCAQSGNAITCWGRNDKGQSDVPALTAPTMLVSGTDHNCVFDQNQIVCWGGDIAEITANIPVVSAPTVLSAGASHACIIENKELSCWGDTNFTAVLDPRELTWPWQVVIGGEGAAETGGEAFACVHHQQGVVCWGDNSEGQTFYDGGPNHTLYRGESVMDVAATDVWSVLMDLSGYPQWNPFTIEMQSTLQLGAAMNMHVKMSENVILQQTENIRVIDHANHKVCWGINTTKPDLLSGERCQWLEVISATQTRYITEDLIEGTAAPANTASFGSAIASGFQGVADNLKIRAEELFGP